MRIVSLIASATEIVCALGLRDQMVGRSHECDYPESIRSLPACTAPKFRVDGTSYEIDKQLRAILQDALSVYHVDAESLSRLEPTHIVTQTQCEVCAVSFRDVEEAVSKIIGSVPLIISLQPNCLSDIYDDIKRVGTALGVESESLSLLDQISKSIALVKDKCNAVEKRPTVALIEWIDPLMPGANWMPELVRLAGGINLFGQEGTHTSVMDWQELSDANPEVMIVAPCGFSIQQTIPEMSSLKAKNGWEKLACVQNNRVYLVDGNQYFNRPGPRVLESLQIMAEIFHPNLFHFGHENKAWCRY